jgi:hypothetical protein
LKRRASELQVGDVIIDRSTRPLTVTAEPTAAKYQGKHPAWRIKVSDGYPSLVVKGDPEITIADDPEEAWSEYAQFRS